MKRTLNAILTLAVTSAILSTQAFAGGKAIYGEDDRVELFSASPQTARLADSVVSLWKYNQAQIDPVSGTLSLQTQKSADEFNLCPGERFSEQQGGGYCTGVLVGDDLVLTAGHCLIEQECEGTKIVFGFAIRKAGGKAPVKMGAADVYSCKQVVSHFIGKDPAPEYTLLRLDRPVVGHKPLAINRNGSLKKGDKVMVLGHPLGLPLKIADGAVRDASPETHFVAGLDAFIGNSGAPVFNAATGLIEGILIFGEKDFRAAPAGCNTAAIYPQDGGGGELVTKISVVKSFIPELPGGNNTVDMSIKDGSPVIGVSPVVDDDLLRRFDAGFQ